MGMKAPGYSCALNKLLAKRRVTPRYLGNFDSMCAMVRGTGRYLRREERIWNALPRPRACRCGGLLSRAGASQPVSGRSLPLMESALGGANQSAAH
jgi:hypothetical protein